MTENSCPIWKTSAIIEPTTRDGVSVNSPRAGGLYFISGTAIAVLQHRDDTLRAQLTTWLVNQRRLGVERPQITSETIDDAAKAHLLTVQERADRLLTNIRNQTLAIGKHFCFSKRYLNEEANSWMEDETFSNMKAWSESIESDDVIYLMDFLAQRKLIQNKVSESGAQSQGPYKNKEDYYEYLVTPDGYAYLSGLEKAPIDSKQVFVAMWFDESMADGYENGIVPAIREAGYEPLRIDQKEHNNKIDDEIIAEIKRSRFLIADFTQGNTGARGGVYYEAGFAHGLNIPVIFTCHADAFKSVHFDTRQYNHIVWESPEDLHKRLAQRISAVIGDGPLKEVIEAL